ncbi:MAG: TetR/AcrR family transcriptional regulator C-terminal ligand-binding domain-containing protein [Myxococcota bacterium]
MDKRAERSREILLGAARTVLFASGLSGLTHLAVARESGLGRKTVYRHFPDRITLLQATLSTAEYPRAKRTGHLRRDLRAHLESLRAALTNGPLAFVVAALAEAATVEPELRPLWDQLATEGCAPLRELLEDAKADGQLPTSLDVERAQASLEGPLFYRALVSGRPISKRSVTSLVDDFLAQHDT